MNHKKVCETLTCKYRKNSENNKFNKILDLSREKAKKGLEKLASTLLFLRYLSG